MVVVRQRLDHRGMDCQHRVEKVCELDAMRLGHETKLVSIAVKTPRATLRSHLDPRLVVPIEQLIGDLAAWVFVGEFEGFGAKPLRADDGDEAIWQNALDGGVRSEVFELAHREAANQRGRLLRSVERTFRKRRLITAAWFWSALCGDGLRSGRSGP